MLHFSDSRTTDVMGDRWLASDGGVGSVVIVEVEPARKCSVAFLG
jgi:hypothetical protein